jgi:hypothetical protein
MTESLRVQDYPGHILKAIERIDRYTADMDEVDFPNSELAQDAVLRNIEIIGEASNNIQRVDPAMPRYTTTFPGRSCIRCATVSHTALHAGVHPPRIGLQVFDRGVGSARSRARVAKGTAWMPSPTG